MSRLLDVQAKHLQYFSAVCAALAHPATHSFPEPAFPDDINVYLAAACRQLDQILAGCTAFAHLHPPMDLAAVTARFLDDRFPTLPCRIERLRHLQQEHAYNEYKRVLAEEQHRARRAHRLSLTLAQRRDELKDYLDLYRDSPSWCDLRADEATLMTFAPPKRNHLLVMRAVASGHYLSASAVGRAVNLSPTRVQQIIARAVCVWACPYYYGEIFALHGVGTLRQPTTELHLVDPQVTDAEGHMQMRVYSGLTLPEALGKVAAFFTSLGSSLCVNCE